MARGLTVVPVSTLEALGAADAADGRRRCARRRVDRRAARRGLRRAVRRQRRAPRSSPRRRRRPRRRSRPGRGARRRGRCVFVGDGAVRYQDVIPRRSARAPRCVDRRRRSPAEAAPHRRGASRARRRCRTRVVPIYVRRPDAELTRERAARAERATRHDARAARSTTPCIERLDGRQPTSTQVVALEARVASPTRGPARCSPASWRNPTSRASTCCACRTAASPRSAPAGSSSTSCTSTRWRSTCRTAGRAWASTLMRCVLAEAAARGVRRATLEVRRVERGRAAASTRSRLSRGARERPRLLHAARRRTRLILLAATSIWRIRRDSGRLQPV